MYVTLAREADLGSVDDVDSGHEVLEPPLWWPVGLGPARLHTLAVDVAPEHGAALAAQRRVGFRTVALVTGNDTDPAYVARAAQEEGTEQLTMSRRALALAVSF